MLQHFIPKYCCLPITTGWLTMGGRGKTTKQTNPKSELETKDAKGTGLLTVGKRSYRTLQIQWQCFTHFTCKFHSLMSSLTEARFQPCLPAAINAGRKTETGLLYSQTSPPNKHKCFSKVAVFKSLSVDMGTIRRLMLSTSSQTDEWGINTKIKLVILHVFSPHLWRVTSSGLRVVQAHRTLWKSKNSGFAVRWLEKGGSWQHFPCFLPLFPVLHLEAAFFPFHISSKNMQSDLVCKNANTVILKYKQLQKSVQSQL